MRFGYRLVMSTTGAPIPQRVPRPVVAAGRRAFRGYGALTADVRRFPEFALIGAKRGGTTSLYYHLLRHPQILPLFPTARFLPKRREAKGAHFFDSNYARGPRWYRSHFASAATRALAARRLGAPVLTGEASPYYLFHPLAAERMASMNPEAKILVSLRDPLQRTFSHYREQRRNGVEKLEFAEALAAEAERTAGEEERIVREPGYRSFPHEQQTYRAQSEYVHGLRRWYDHFPAKNIHVVISEDYYADAVGVTDEIFAFLGLPPAGLDAADRLNPAPPSAMSDETRTTLLEHFAPFTAELETLLGRSLPWERPAS
jgi:hypothetical protein